MTDEKEDYGDVAAYIRVSTEEQRDNDSHVRQRQKIETWAEHNSCESITWFEDTAVSGQASTRESYNELMDSYDDYDAVVVRELSRFGRDALTVLRDVEEIIESDTDFVSITENFDTSSAMGEAFMKMVAVINDLYANLRREQAVAAVEKRREEGKHVGRPKKLNEGELEEVYDLRRKGVSYNAIAAVMTEKADVEELSGQTVMRYCREAEVEPEQ